MPLLQIFYFLPRLSIFFQNTINETTWEPINIDLSNLLTKNITPTYKTCTLVNDFIYIAWHIYIIKQSQNFSASVVNENKIEALIQSG